MSDSDATTTGTPALARAVTMLATRPAAAELVLRDILSAHPGDINAALYLSRALRAQRKTRRAVDVLQALIERHPSYAPAHYELALAQADRGANDKAATTLRHALDLDRTLRNGWLVLADLLFEMGDKTGADAAYREHIAISADAAHIREAAKALQDGNVLLAEKTIRTHLAGLPADLAALAVLGEIMGRLGECEEAVFLLGRCIARAPGFLAARFNCAVILCRLQRAEDALAQTDILLKAKPEDRDFRGLRAVALVMSGNGAQATLLYEALLAETPGDAKVWTAYGSALRGAGRQVDALDAYRRSASLDVAHGGAHWGIADMKTVRFEPDEIATLRTALARRDLSDDDRLHFCFALGKALEDEGDFAASFALYAEGNALKRAALGGNDTALRERFDALKAFFTPEFFDGMREAGAPGADPIFIVGLPRSGTTLIEQILDSHSAVEGTSELPAMREIVRLLKGNPWQRNAPGYPDGLGRIGSEGLRRLGEDYISRTRSQRKSGKPFFTDKMPSNFEHIGLIQLILPNAKIIDARRHPIGCCLSNFKQLYANGQEFTYDLTSLGRYYAGYVELVAHFDAVLPGRVHRVFHENMVENPEREIRALLDYCGLPFEAACLRFHENTRQVRTVSSEQVRRPIFSDGVERWRHYEPWLGPLKEALRPVLDAYPDTPRSERA